jgi:hypothetical protein
MQKFIKESGSGSSKRKLTPNDISIIKTYKCGKYILAEHEVSCCFEGFIVLYKMDGKNIKQVVAFNGYNNNGVYIGFDAINVKIIY